MNENTLCAGAQVIHAGGFLTVSPELAERFRPGDRLVVAGGELLHLPLTQVELAASAVQRAQIAFAGLATLEESCIDSFYEEFAGALADDAVWARIATANASDIRSAQERGRSTTRLVANEKMRQDMIAGLAEWGASPGLRNRTLETVQHPGWTLQLVASGLGVVGFVFEGRPNVLADATGVFRGGNTAVMRIGSDALNTARAIMREALQPALTRAGLPEDSVVLLDSPEHAAGWALFSHSGLSLAVARGSGQAVEQLGSIARQVGTPVSLHGTGGAWMVADDSADPQKLSLAIYHSLDRKVCNTLNTLCLPTARVAELMPIVVAALEARGNGYKLHVEAGSVAYVPESLFQTAIKVRRAGGLVEEMQAEILPPDQLGKEWEWEGTPELTLCVVQDTDQAIALCNTHSPRFVASLLSELPQAHEHFFQTVDAPFVGDGFTRWVDGQYALSRPELGLSNWQFGRLLGRPGILSGDDVYTVRVRVRQSDPHLHR